MLTNRKKATFVSVVIPALNEGKNIGRVIREVKGILDGRKYEIVVVDGYSTDNTVEISKKLGARIIYDEVGKGSALIKGLGSAKGDIVVSMDADLSNEPKELELLISGVEIGFDVCMGSRFVTGGNSEDISFIRVLGNRFFVHLVNVLFGSRYSDMCYGYRSFNRHAVRTLGLKETGFGIETEISIKAIKHHLKTLEVPSVEKKRVAGDPKLRTFRDGYVILRTILKNIG
ncbi:MAG: glycosyltransferase family 2 protein [Candidatus Micrarchaeota archaeon]|nr:glycosyltransferase family 2 protein [Candidatus Micrarchaeota archaeon]MDE1859089.1 glycosyltransferase family 2 protein [Candidatus Micrarchaeota archaeon]